MEDRLLYDVIIIGGSHAGLSAAMTLGRARRETLIIDAGQPCNLAADNAHNVIGRDGTPPMELLELERADVLKYPSVTEVRTKATAISGADDEFEVATELGISFIGRKILMATGVVDILPDIPGIFECWGKTAIHCPYCHAYELVGERIGILAHGETAWDMARLIRQWKSQVFVLSNNHDDIGFDLRRILREENIPLYESEVSEVRHTGSQVTAVKFTDGSELALDALYIRPGVAQSGRLALDIGLELDHHQFIITDHNLRTNLPGVFAAGDCCNASRSIAQAIGQGNLAAMCINHELLEKPERVNLKTIET